METCDFAMVDGTGLVVDRIVVGIDGAGAPVMQRPAGEDEAEAFGVSAGEMVTVPFTLPDRLLVADPAGASTIGGRWDGTAFLSPEA